MKKKKTKNICLLDDKGNAITTTCLNTIVLVIYLK